MPFSLTMSKLASQSSSCTEPMMTTQKSRRPSGPGRTRVMDLTPLPERSWRTLLVMFRRRERR